MLFHGLRGEGINKGVVANIAAKQNGRKVVLLGDSNNANGYAAAATTANYYRQSLFGCLRIKSAGRLDFDQDHLFAQGGAAFSDTITEGRLASALAIQPDIAIVALLVNDVNGGRTYAAIVADINAYVAAFKAIGTRVLFIGLHPTTTSPGGPTSAERIIGYQVNKYLADLALSDNMVMFYNPFRRLVDVTSATSAPATGMLSDEVHMTATAHMLCAQDVWNMLSQIVPERDIIFSNPEDVYDPTTNRKGNLITNGILNGTAGTVTGSIGASGNVATSFTLNKSGTLGTMTCVGSLVARTDRVGSWQQYVMSGTPGGAFAYTFDQTVSNASNIVAGQQYRLVVPYELDAGSSNFLGVRAGLVDGAGATFVSSDGVFTTGHYMPAVADSGILRTEPLTKISGTTSLSCRVFCDFQASAASATVRIGPVKLELVE